MSQANSSITERNLKIKESLKKDLGFANIMEVPKIVKIVVNVGLGQDAKDSKVFESVKSDLAKITGQCPVITKARKSVASFSLRKGNEIGYKVTLRGKRMYEFIEKFTLIACPRIRDFRGLPSNSFDKQGNYSCGIRDMRVFPELEDQQVLSKSRGMDITIVTTASDAKASKALLKAYNFPIADNS